MQIATFVQKLENQALETVLHGSLKNSENSEKKKFVDIFIFYLTRSIPSSESRLDFKNLNIRISQAPWLRSK